MSSCTGRREKPVPPATPFSISFRLLSVAARTRLDDSLYIRCTPNPTRAVTGAPPQVLRRARTARRRSTDERGLSRELGFADGMCPMFVRLP